MTVSLGYLFFNFFVFDSYILPKAAKEKYDHNYKSAIFLYNLAYPFYKINHSTEKNKEIYFKIPYELSICYLKEKNIGKSIESISKGLVSVKKEYGTYSNENAAFVRKYLISYHLERDDIKSAEKELGNLLTIYKKTGYNEDEVGDISRLKGDIYYQKKEYDNAIIFYKRAYKAISFDSQTDYEIFAKIVTRICNYELANNNRDKAIELYKKAINTFKDYAHGQSELSAELRLKLGDIYRTDDLSLAEAIKNYEEATIIIKELPKSSILRQNLEEYLTILKDLYVKVNDSKKSDALQTEILKLKRFSLPF